MAAGLGLEKNECVVVLKKKTKFKSLDSLGALNNNHIAKMCSQFLETGQQVKLCLHKTVFLNNVKPRREINLMFLIFQILADV